MRIEDICESLHQGLNTAGQKVKFVKDGFPIIQTRNIDNGNINTTDKLKFLSKKDWQKYNEKYKPKIGDVFFTNIGTIGKTAIVKNEMDYLIHWNIFKLRPNLSLCTSGYLKLILDHLTSKQYFQKLQKGGTVNFVTKKMISDVDILLPPLEEQQDIVAKLDASSVEINKLIESTKMSIKNINEYIGKVTDSLIHNDLDNYKNFTLDDITNKITCGVAKRPIYINKGVIFLSARNVKHGKMKWDNHKFISEKAHKILTQNSKPEIGDILYSRVGAGFGDAAIIDRDDELSIFVSLTLIKVKPIVLNEYLYYYLNSPKIKELARKNITGTGVGNLNVTAVKLFKIKLPDLKKQKIIINKLKLIKMHVKNIINIHNKKLSSYTSLKNSISDSLIYKKKAKAT